MYINIYIILFWSLPHLPANVQQKSPQEMLCARSVFDWDAYISTKTHFQGEFKEYKYIFSF